ncbi:hypothetical protein PHMEG_0003041 [Phytophthora megakarya]|uniref:Uncharacterized protein n=1 Tax=Phytophthora megakarya TaxID=4795 RepID=A0A225WZB3_9STRA|nr:hypothetical protein PHMEG_0003041 [Phytophthora megakarya]
MVAATNETVKTLKRKLLKLLSAVGDKIAAQSKEKNREQTTEVPVAEFQSLETLHAMAVKTQRGAIKLTEDDEVMVRLRWSLMLKPMLFKPLLQHAIALKALPSIITACPLWTSQELERLVAFVDVAKREIILGRMRESRRELEQLERDLVEAPPHLFPHIFMFFELIEYIQALSADNQNLLVLATNILFALFDRRSHDGDSYFDVLGLLLRQSLASSSLWLDHQQFYVQTIEALSETATLQVEPKLKWAAKMALQQLLFECDVHLLQLEQSSLSKLLPPSTMRLVSIRFN